MLSPSLRLCDRWLGFPLFKRDSPADARGTFTVAFSVSLMVLWSRIYLDNSSTGTTQQTTHLLAFRAKESKLTWLWVHVKMTKLLRDQDNVVISSGSDGLEELTTKAVTLTCSRHVQCIERASSAPNNNRNVAEGGKDRARELMWRI